jgi:hypothetical protein
MNFFRFSYLARLVLLVSFVSLAGLAQAQKPKPSPTPPRDDDQESITTFIRRVRLPITVVDKKGQFIPGLTRNDFLIFEDPHCGTSPARSGVVCDV